ncbi:retrovirus-related pol polyprotein from transposon TNT 1-94 [Tanacetum coccineum]
MSSMSEDIQYAGSDTRPPMLDRTDFESWQQRIRLYCLGKDNGENIIKSITKGPFQMGTTTDIIPVEGEGPPQQGQVRARVFTELSTEDKERYKADIRATNILLQGSELTKDDRESQLYDEFEHFCQIKGETIHVYYVRFTKLINDMRNIKMTMPRMQLNSKFVNNMLPEWSRFITEVKLNRGLKESNFDQLYAYLKQHEVHANENRMMMERFSQATNDPLALVSNASIQQHPSQSYTTPQSSYQPSPVDNFQLDSGSTSTDNLIESLTNTLTLLTQSFKSHLPQTNNQLRTSSNARNKATVQDGRVVVQDVRDRFNANIQGRQFQRNNARGAGGTGNVGGQNRGGNMNPGQAKPIVCYNCKGIRHIARECPQPKRPQDSDYFKDKMLLMQARENGAELDEEQLLFLAGEQVTNFDADVDDLALNVDHVFEADQCDAFDSDVDEAPTTPTIFMANLTSDEAGTSYDSNFPSEVQDSEYYSDCEDKYHEVHETQSDVQQDYVVDSDADYTNDSNVISYDQYVEDNAEHVVPSNVSSVQNDAFRSIFDEMHEEGELVGEYEKREKFELTDREQKIEAQMRIIILDRNRKETSLKSELHTAQMQLRSILNQFKSKTEEVTIMKNDFKQKENKFIEEFLDIKKLKEKVEDRLYKQGQTLQTVHMLWNPKPFYDEKKKVAIGYKNPLCLTHAKQVQRTLYDGHVLVLTNHARPVIHHSEESLEMAELSRKRMMEKMKSPLCVENKVKIAPPNYSKENHIAIFTPQRTLTPEQLYWSHDMSKTAKTVPKPLSALTVYPPNTPAKLVPRVLPTKSQVKIQIYVLTQLFTEFDKTCKKRITPTGVTEGERGFEQTKRCYLTEVIPFFKTLKEHFEGVKTALFKEVKVLEEVFDQMNDAVDQYDVDKQCAEIVKKNLLIEIKNLIANCLSNQLLYDVEKSRCLDLEAEISKVQNEIKHISKLERENLNLQLKCQHLQESFDNDKSQTSQEAPDFNSFFKIKNLEHQIQEKDNVIRDLKVIVSNVNNTCCEPYNANDVTDLLEQNERLRAETEKVKQHYKELFESIKITRASTLKVATRSSVKPKVLAPGMYAIDMEPIPPRLKNNRSAHLDYIYHLKESVETVREIVEVAKVLKPLDTTLNSACKYSKLSQELVEYVIGTCPKEVKERDNRATVFIPLTRKKQVTFTDTCSVSSSTEANGSKPRSNTKNNRILPAKSVNKKKVEDHPRTNKSVWTKVNRVDSSISSKRVLINSISESVCKTCNKCLNSANHVMCVVNVLKSVHGTPTGTPTVKTVWNKTKLTWKPKGKMPENSLNKTKRVWKATGKLFANVGYKWRPTGNQYALGKLNCGYQWRPTGKKFALGEMCPSIQLPVKCCSKHMTGNRSKLKNFVEKFIGTVRFKNDHFGAIMGYGDYVMGDSVISRVYYVEGLGHNLFSVGQFCDSDLEVAFRKHSCFVRNMDGVDLLKGCRSTNLYTISIDEMMKSSPVCLLSKASKIKSWLWHRRLNHLNFGTINDLARKDLVRVLHTLHMDLCGPMRVQSINGKRYILVIVDDYSRFTWVKFLRSKDETPEFVINFLKQIQVGLNKTVRYIRTDNGTEFVKQVMSKYYEGVGISHQKSVPRTPQQNGVVERRNRTLVEATRTMLIFSKAPMFLWAEAVATACYTQNRSLIHTRHNKTPYELVHDKNPDLSFL